MGPSGGSSGQDPTTTMADAMVVRAVVDAAPLDLAVHVAEVEHPACGALATFVGRVRDHAPDAPGEVVSLDYSAHPSAGDVLARLVRRVLDDEVCGIVRVAVSHRVGHLAVGDLAVVVCVATAHRQDAFAICRRIVEDVKRELPVWKRQQTRDGTTNWVGLPSRSGRP